MVRCGTGTSADDAELILCPLPGVRARQPRDRNPGLCVSRMMIREDVWQAICAMPVQSSYGAASTLESRIEEVRATWEMSLTNADMRRFMFHHDKMVACDQIPFTVGLGTHWWAMVDMWLAGSVTEAERDDFLRTAAELEFVARWLGMTRYQWRPSGASGPQCGEYGLHAALLGAFANVATTIHEARRRDEDDDA